MKKKLLVINLVLLGIGLVLIQQFRSQWSQFKAAHGLRALNPQAEQGGPGPKAPDKTDLAANYIAIINNHLFTPDRTNLIPPEPPPPPAPKKVLPPKPVLSGVLRLGGDEFVLMISSDPRQRGGQKRLRKGEGMDGYTLVSIQDQRVIMRAEDEEVEIRLSEPSGLVARESSAPATPSGGGSRVTTIGESGSTTEDRSSKAVSSTAPGKQNKPPADFTPPGKRKIRVQTPFGPMDSYEDIK
jgi:hypothetical protein